MAQIYSLEIAINLIFIYKREYFVAEIGWGEKVDGPEVWIIKNILLNFLNWVFWLLSIALFKQIIYRFEIKRNVWVLLGDRGSVI